MSRSPYRSLYVLDTAQAFGAGFLTLVFVVDARRLGLDALGIGLLSGASVLVGLLYTFVSTRVSYRAGARLPLALAGLLMAATGIVLALAHTPGQMELALFLGFLPPSGGLFVTTLSEGVLAHAPSSGRLRVFARRGFLTTVGAAVGALLPTLSGLLGFSSRTAEPVLFGIYATTGLVVTTAALSVRDDSVRDRLVQAGGHGRGERSNALAVGVAASSRSGLGVSRRAVQRLALLFIADSFGSGLVAPTLLVYWLSVRFGMSLGALGILFFGMDVLTAVSFPLAVWVSGRLGLLNTAVFTHIPSSLLLIAVPFAPTGAIAAAFLLARALLVEMDVPTRQSYIAAIVEPDERKAAAAMTGGGKQIGRALGPPIGGVTLALYGALAPFVAGGVVKIAYDLTLWGSFRRHAHRTEASTQTEVTVKSS